jgi:hypothetical protein
MSVASLDVRFRGQSGHHLLILSFPAFDPKRRLDQRDEGDSLVNALCEFAHARALIDDGECKHSRVGGAN